MKRWQKIVGVAIAILVVVVVVLSFVLDGILTAKAKEQAQKMSQEWGRPVQIGSVATKLLTGLGVRVSDVQIGAASGEDMPLVDLKRAEVRVALLRAIFSAGKSVQVRSAEVQGLTVNVERLRDGTTNLQRFQEKLAANAETKPKDEKQSDLSFLRVDHAALLDGKIAFIDKATRGAKELAVQHLDLTVNDLRSGRPLVLLLKAAVLADKQNLEVRLKTAPLPATLTPTPTSVALHVNPPIDIGPLGPFVGKDVGLQAGTLDADFDAQLGAAVAGGSGPTTVKGAIKLAGLSFAGAEGGKKLDVSLDTDLKGDAAAGDVRIDKLKLDVGPAGITGHGSGKGLTSPSPRIEGLEIVSHDLDPARLAAYYPPLRESLGKMLAGPIGLTVRGSGTQSAQALEPRGEGDEAVRPRPRFVSSRSGPYADSLDEEEGGEQTARSGDVQGALRTRQGADRAPDDEEADGDRHRRGRGGRGGPRQGQYSTAQGVRRDRERWRDRDAPRAPRRALPPGDEARRRRPREPGRAGNHPQAAGGQVQRHHRPARRWGPGEDAGGRARRKRGRRGDIWNGHICCRSLGD